MQTNGSEKKSDFFVVLLHFLGLMGLLLNPGVRCLDTVSWQLRKIADRSCLFPFFAKYDILRPHRILSAIYHSDVQAGQVRCFCL